MTDISARPSVTFDLTVLDTDEPERLGRFYADLLGWKVVGVEDDWVTVRGDGGPGLAFQLAVNYRPPTWPDNSVPQQYHLDLDVADLDEGVAYAESLGATKADNSSSAASFVVMLDPSGHPFCLCRED